MTAFYVGSFALRPDVAIITFTGSISNTGTIAAADAAIALSDVNSFGGGIVNAASGKLAGGRAASNSAGTCFGNAGRQRRH